MAEQTSVRCYIEEYETADGRVGARLREKSSGRKVDLGATSPSKRQDFLRFLSAAAIDRSQHPDIFEKVQDANAIAVSGRVDFDSPDELRFIYDHQLSYLIA